MKKNRNNIKYVLWALVLWLVIFGWIFIAFSTIDVGLSKGEGWVLGGFVFIMTYIACLGMVMPGGTDLFIV